MCLLYAPQLTVLLRLQQIIEKMDHDHLLHEYCLIGSDYWKRGSTNLWDLNERGWQY